MSDTSQFNFNFLHEASLKMANMTTKNNAEKFVRCQNRD